MSAPWGGGLNMSQMTTCLGVFEIGGLLLLLLLELDCCGVVIKRVFLLVTWVFFIVTASSCKRDAMSCGRGGWMYAQWWGVIIVIKFWNDKMSSKKSKTALLCELTTQIAVSWTARRDMGVMALVQEILENFLCNSLFLQYYCSL